MPAASSSGTGTGTETKSSAQDQKNAKDACTKRIQEAADFFNNLQKSPDTAVPDPVLTLAKAVVFIDRWSGAVGVGGTGGSGIAFKKDDKGLYRGPAFYDVAGGSLGAQIGVSHVRTLAFLMSEKALQTLSNSSFMWSGNLRAIAGDKSISKSSLNDTVDVILYQTASGLDVGATIAATKLSPDDKNNRIFYNNATITTTEIFGGKSPAPGAKDLTDELKKFGK